MYRIKAAIVDLDGTLCNSKHREHHVTKEKKDWDSFYRECTMDAPNEWCLDIVKAIQPTHQILFVTGRSDAYKSQTEKWLRDTGLRNYKLFMRKDKDFRKDTEIKKEIYKDWIFHDYDVSFCIEDRLQVVEMWRSLGLVCLQCAEGKF